MAESSKPLVSIVVASYNHCNHIEKTLQSISLQDYRPLELLVIDDGSTDGSGELLESLQVKYDFRLIRRENGGLVSVINLGIIQAKGEYVIFHASDDESLPGRVSGQLRVLERYPDAAFVSGNVAFVAEDGSNKGTLLTVTGKQRELGFDDIFLQRARVSSVASMYRANALKEMGGINEKYRAEDPQLFLKLTHLGYSWIQWAGSPVIAYRMLFSSQSRTIMPLLLRENALLIDEFSSHRYHSEASALVKVALISSLAEFDKRAALKELATGTVNWLSVGFARALIKVLLPKKYHYIFKRAGRQV